jgi:hypothetical protein
VAALRAVSNRSSEPIFNGLAICGSIRYLRRFGAYHIVVAKFLK